MIVLPIAERELRVAARASRTYWSRSLAAVVVMILSVFVFDSYERFGRANVGGHQVFAVLAYLALAYSVFAGAALTADCLSSEKREDTLGLLFLTDLKGYDVVFGKLCATSLRSIYGLLATFPVMSLPLLLGGLKGAEFWRVVLVILNTLFLSLSMGLLISTLYRGQRVTTHLASLAMLLLTGVPAAFSFMLKAMGGTSALLLDPGVISPIYSMMTSFDFGYKVAQLVGPSYWCSLLTQFVIAALLLARASRLLPHSWQPKEAPRPMLQGWVENPVGRFLPIDEQRRSMLDANPYYWLAGRGRAMTAGMMFVIGVIAFWALSARDDREAFAAAQGVGLILVSLILRLFVAVAAAQRLTEDKESGALDLIITTPLTVAAIVSGQWKAIRRKLGIPFVASLGLSAFLIFGPWNGEGSSGRESLVRWFIAAAFCILSVTDLFALGWLGIWNGLHVRNVPHGAASSLLRVVVPPAVIAGGLVWANGIMSADEYFRTKPYWIPALWLVLGLITALSWGVWARRKVLTEFRSAAADRFAQKASPGRRWWQMSTSNPSST